MQGSLLSKIGILVAMLSLLTRSSDSIAFNLTDGIELSGGAYTSAQHNDTKQNAFNLYDTLPASDAYDFETLLQVMPKIKTHYFTLSGDGFYTYHTPDDKLTFHNNRSTTTGKVREALLEVTPLDPVVVGVGRSRLKWGSGYYWNPSQPLSDIRQNQADLMRLDERAGNDLAYFELNLPSFSVGFFNQKGEMTTDIASSATRAVYSNLLRLHMFLDRFDLALNAGALNSDNFSSFSLSSAVTDALELHAEGAYHSGDMQLIPSFRPVTTPSGGTTKIYSFQQSKFDRPYDNLLLGGQYTFESNINITAEYIYNGSGYDADEFKRLVDQANLAAANIHDTNFGMAHRAYLMECSYMTQFMLRQHYLFTRIKLDDLPWSTSIALSNRQSLEDDGFIAGGSLKIRIGGHGEAGVDIAYFYGNERSEAELSPYRSMVTTTLAVKF